MGMFDFVVRDNLWGDVKSERAKQLADRQKTEQALLDQKFGREAQDFVAAAEEKKRKDDLKRMMLGTRMIASEDEISRLDPAEQERLKQQLTGIASGDIQFVDPTTGTGYASKDAFIASGKRAAASAAEEARKKADEAAAKRENDLRAANKAKLAADKAQFVELMAASGKDADLAKYLEAGDLAGAMEHTLSKPDAEAGGQDKILQALDKLGAGKQREARSRSYSSTASLDPKMAADLVDTYYRDETGGVDEIAVASAGDAALERVMAGMTGDQAEALQKLYKIRDARRAKQEALQSKGEIARVAGTASMVAAIRAAIAKGDMAKAQALDAQYRREVGLDRNNAMRYGYDKRAFADAYGADMGYMGRVDAATLAALGEFSRNIAPMILEGKGGEFAAQADRLRGMFPTSNQQYSRTSALAELLSSGLGGTGKQTFVTSSSNPSEDTSPGLAASQRSYEAFLERQAAAQSKATKRGAGAKAPKSMKMTPQEKARFDRINKALKGGK